MGTVLAQRLFQDDVLGCSGQVGFGRTRIHHAAGGEWLRNVYAAPFGYFYMVGDWTRVLDGMVYTRDMTPSTPATR